MRLSIVVPAFNSEGTLASCLASIRKSSFQEYEIIVVDDGSTDSTKLIAARFTDQLIAHKTNRGRSAARNKGAKSAKEEVIVFLDSDVMVKSDTLSIIVRYFVEQPEVDAVSGLLAKQHPNRNFFSQYKNLYMHYIFTQLPEQIDFLYGSIHALRREALLPYGTDVSVADDTALGQRLVKNGKKIAFIPDLEVIHLKSYSLCSFVFNDFRIPFDWAIIFIRNKGWRQLGKGGTGFAHAPVNQLTSLVIAPMNLVLGAGCLYTVQLVVPTILLLTTWYVLNHRFTLFLKRERGVNFGLLSIPVTFVDHLVMDCGIITGVFASIFLRDKVKKVKD